MGTPSHAFPGRHAVRPFGGFIYFVHAGQLQCYIYTCVFTQIFRVTYTSQTRPVSGLPSASKASSCPFLACLARAEEDQQDQESSLVTLRLFYIFHCVWTPLLGDSHELPLIKTRQPVLSWEWKSEIHPRLIQGKRLHMDVFLRNEDVLSVDLGRSHHTPIHSEHKWHAFVFKGNTDGGKGSRKFCGVSFMCFPLCLTG